jgi:hypothetical protein
VPGRRRRPIDGRRAPNTHVSLAQYGEFRQGFNKDKADTRLVSYGIRYLVENYIAKRWTMEDVEMADAFYKYVVHA